MTNTKKEVLLSIVKTWNISERPEYRGFRCACCQEYKNEAWYHWVTSHNFLLPLHLCDTKCEKALLNNSLDIDTTKLHETDTTLFGQNHSYSLETISAFRQIISSWKISEKPLLKAFTCDLCDKELTIEDGVRKGWHVWWNNSGTLTELHFHKECGEKLHIT
jgi:hypothetical protein